MPDSGLNINDLPPLTSPPSKRRSPYEWAVMLLGCEMAFINCGLGVALLFSDERRFSAPSFNPIKELMPIPDWGYIFIATAIVALLGQAFFRYGVVALSHALAGSACLFWTIGFWRGLANPLASATGIWAYGGLALVHLTIAGTTLVAALRTHRV